jgi:hypothetical protein
MSDFPPVLTPERIDAMLAAVAQVCMPGRSEPASRAEGGASPVCRLAEALARR